MEPDWRWLLLVVPVALILVALFIREWRIEGKRIAAESLSRATKRGQVFRYDTSYSRSWIPGRDMRRAVREAHPEVNAIRWFDSPEEVVDWFEEVMGLKGEEA